MGDRGVGGGMLTKASQAAPRTQSTTCSDSSQSTLDPDSSVRAVSGSSAVFGGDSASRASSLSGDSAADRRLEPLLDAADSADRAESTESDGALLRRQLVELDKGRCAL